MQVKDLLGKLKNRDEARNMDRPVLEHLYLRDCGLSDQDFDTLTKAFPSVVCKRKLPSVLRSSTWVGTGKSASMT